jgi:metal-dependent amidase/aminoacylase/carboxypeptidase family protein
MTVPSCRHQKASYKPTNWRSHPFSEEEFSKDVLGIAGRSSIACYDITAVYRGVSAHASASPWEGVNALDALVMAYNSISMLRQQMKPDERVHGAILEAPTVTNAIPELTRTKYSIRSPTVKGARALGDRVRKCLESGALSSGCTVELEENQMFADLVVNPPLCESFQECMREQGERILAYDEIQIPGSTDQGNVSQLIPALHGIIGIPVSDGAKNHTRQFTAAAGTSVAHQRMVTAGKAMAVTGWKLLVNEEFYGNVRNAFTEASGRTRTRS